MKTLQLVLLALAALLATAVAAPAQPRPYLGFVYPAGGQQGTTVPIRLGGQNLDGVNEAMVSGLGVSAKVVEYCRRLNNQETALLKEQLAELKKPAAAHDEAKRKLAERIERRLAEFVATPAAASLSSVVLVEVTLARDAKPGRRELVLATPRGVSNPLALLTRSRCVSSIAYLCCMNFLTSSSDSGYFGAVPFTRSSVWRVTRNVYSLPMACFSTVLQIALTPTFRKAKCR